ATGIHTGAAARTESGGSLIFRAATAEEHEESDESDQEHDHGAHEVPARHPVRNAVKEACDHWFVPFKENYPVKTGTRSMPLSPQTDRLGRIARQCLDWHRFYRTYATDARGQ